MAGHAGVLLFDRRDDPDGLADVVFMIKRRSIKAHRAIVSCQGGLLKELVKDEKKDKIEIDNVGYSVFRDLIRFLYTNETPVTEKNIFELMDASHKYQIEKLEKYCSEAGILQITNENIGEMTSKALEHSAKTFLGKCKDHFKENAEEIVKTEEFLKFESNVIEEMCSVEGTNISTLDLFAACVRWAKKNTKGKSKRRLREALSGVLNKLKFSDMPIEDFLDFVVPLEYLTIEQVGKAVAEIQEKKKHEHWTEDIKVTIQNYKYQLLSLAWNEYKDTELTLPLTTRISQVKEMKLFNGGEESYPSGEFTLSHDGKVLGDDVSLASLYSPGKKELVLKIHSINVVVRVKSQEWYLDVTIDTDDLSKETDFQKIESEVYETMKILPIATKLWRPKEDSDLNKPSGIVPGCVYILELVKLQK